MYAICWRFSHDVLKTQTFVTVIVIPWGNAFVVTLCANPLQFVNKSSIELVMSFLINPLVVTRIAYLVLWMKERS